MRQICLGRPLDTHAILDFGQYGYLWVLMVCEILGVWGYGGYGIHNLGVFGLLEEGSFQIGLLFTGFNRVLLFIKF